MKKAMIYDMKKTLIILGGVLGNFLLGWFIFQYTAMKKMTDSKHRAFWMAGRAEFFSMIPLMFAMGFIMKYITPEIAGQSPNPDTFAFWGFGALGLFAGTIFTYPMNWWLVSIGWKHGMS